MIVIPSSLRVLTPLFVQITDLTRRMAITFLLVNTDRKHDLLFSKVEKSSAKIELMTYDVSFMVRSLLKLMFAKNDPCQTIGVLETTAH